MGIQGNVERLTIGGYMGEEKSLLPARQVREVPVVEFISNGERVGTVNARIEHRPGRFEVSVFTVPVTRVGRTLPDWPEALSLKPDSEKRRN